jgi:hypothetical protein
MRRLPLLVTLLLLAPLTFASGWKKPYFGATKSGSWAKYTDVAGEMKMTSVSARFADDGERRARLGSRTEFANNQYPPVVNEYTLAKDFPIGRELIDFMTAITGGSATASEGPLQPFEAATIEAIKKSSQAYGPVVTFKGTETIDGKNCDRYGYTLKRPGDPVTVESGDLWLSDAVPFGVVKQTSTTKDAKGKVVSSYMHTLVVSGLSGSPLSLSAPSASAAEAPKLPDAYTLQEAFDAGVISITVSVDEASKNGERAHLHIAGKEDRAFALTVPKGKGSLHVDGPIDDFLFDVPAAKTFRVSGAKAAEIDVRQLGQQRVVKGQFEISMYEGKALFSGSVTVDWVK